MYLFGILCIVQSQAFVLVSPTGILDAREEVVARDNNQSPLLQPLVELLAVDGQPFKPQPEEQRPLGLVDAQLGRRDGLLQPPYRLLGLVLVLGADMLLAQTDDVAALDPALHHTGADATGCQVDDP